MVSTTKPGVPSILVVGCEGADRARLVSCISGVDTVQLSESPLQRVSWTIDNKYYTANVDLVLVDTPESVDEQSWQTVDGLVYLYHAHEPATWKGLCAWRDGIQQHSPEVLLCVAKHPDESQPSDDYKVPEELDDWCNDNGFEHVDVYEWKPGHLGPGGLEDETEGMDRVVEALHSNTWEGLVRKPERRGQTQSQENDGAAQNTTQAAPEAPQQDQEDPDELALRAFLTPAEKRLVSGELFKYEGRGDGEEEEMENMDNMFVNLAALKDRAQNLPDSQRRLLAEKVSLAFYRAMAGGDGEEEEDEDY
eukprot:comp16953_c0_seq1/m.15560 comp16953_c0_seq1/g.15560  ORF comp16953_c0_seq1/g.15560 comp16953_c0_seq1/m.15560 type:complete len:307 (-) comp16953_c0_seq1:231-1151(-)